ncbi:7133_t:CDS:1, partial [Funneliformis caledonium]
SSIYRAAVIQPFSIIQRVSLVLPDYTKNLIYEYRNKKIELYLEILGEVYLRSALSLEKLTS